MTQLQREMQLEESIAYWGNCRGKGTVEQQAMVERTIADLRSRLRFAQADAYGQRIQDAVDERD